MSEVCIKDLLSANSVVKQGNDQFELIANSLDYNAKFKVKPGEVTTSFQYKGIL